MPEGGSYSSGVSISNARGLQNEHLEFGVEPLNHLGKLGMRRGGGRAQGADSAETLGEMLMYRMDE